MKKQSEEFLTLDQCIDSNFHYEYFRSRLTNHTNKKLSKNKIKETINQTDLVPITFGVLISKERNSKKVSPKQNSVHQRNTYINILMSSGAHASIIRSSYSNFVTRKTSANKWSTMAGYFSTLHEAESKKIART